MLKNQFDPKNFDKNKILDEKEKVKFCIFLALSDKLRPWWEKRSDLISRLREEYGDKVSEDPLTLQYRMLPYDLVYLTLSGRKDTHKISEKEFYKINRGKSSNQSLSKSK